MLRTNLSTRPFYNERAVHAGLLIATLVVVALTAVNVLRIVSLSRQNTELSTRIHQEHAEAARLAQEAATIRGGVDRDQLSHIVAAAGEANALIDQRTFSWTEFFNRLEATMPPDVMLTAVRPTFTDGQVSVVMNLLGRRAEDIDEFMERLESTGAFENVLPTREDVTEQGLYRVALSAMYLPDAGGLTEPDQPVTGGETGGPPAEQRGVAMREGAGDPS
jgi:Tfp pilus assembly protein PilN